MWNKLRLRIDVYPHVRFHAAWDKLRAVILALPDDVFFRKILYNKTHVLHSCLLDMPKFVYALRTRSHNKSLICKRSDLNDRIFLVRAIYKDCY